MPDRDIFQKRFKGSGPLGWQGIARLLNYDPARLDIDSKINTAFARTLKKLPPNFMRNIVDIVRTAMREEHLNRALRNGKDAFLNLTYKLRVESGGNEFEVSEIIKNAVQSFFLANRDRPLPSNDHTLVVGLADKVGEKLIDAQLFSKIRDVLRSKSGKDVSAEISWERSMINRSLPYIRLMIGRYLAEEGRVFRAPAIRGLRRKSTEEILHELITVLPTGGKRPNV